MHKKLAHFTYGPAESIRLCIVCHNNRYRFDTFRTDMGSLLIRKCIVTVNNFRIFLIKGFYNIQETVA